VKFVKKLTAAHLTLHMMGFSKPETGIFPETPPRSPRTLQPAHSVFSNSNLKNFTGFLGNFFAECFPSSIVFEASLGYCIQ
jgi:hypothetical protein